MLAIIFNLPRIIVLSVLGTLIGILAYFFKDAFISALPPIFISIQAIGYGLLGIFILFFGAYMFTTSVDKQEDLKERDKASVNEPDRKKKVRKIKGCRSCGNDRNCVDKVCNVENVQGPEHCEDSGILSFIRKRIKNMEDKPNKLFFFWGSLLSIVCLGEIIMVELTIISGSIGIMSNTLMEAAVFGGAAMFMFAIGASIPIIIVALVSSSLSGFVKTAKILESVKTIFGIVMIMAGLAFIFVFVNTLITIMFF